jgi:nucleoside phosphorylase
LDIIESSYPNPISIQEICSTTQTEEAIVRQLVDELAAREKINSTDDGQHFTRTTKPIDTKVNMVKQMPKVTKSQQPVIAIITAQYCEKLAVDSMISDKETFVRYRVSNGQEAGHKESSSNYVYTLGNIGDHRVVSTKLTSVGHSRGALIAAGNATTRLLGTFPEIEYVFMVGCGGGIANYTDFSAHVRLGDIVVSHLPNGDLNDKSLNDANLSCHPSSAASGNPSSSDFVYVHCREKQQDQTKSAPAERASASIPVSYSIHKNLKKAAGGVSTTINGSVDETAADGDKNSENPSSSNNGGSKHSSESGNNNTTPVAKSSSVLTYEECHFRLWRPVNLDLQELAQRLWLQGLDNPTQRIWNYYIDEGIATLKQQDIEASRPTADTDKLYMSIGMNDTIEVNHPEAAEDEVDLRRDGRPMCHFGPIGSGRPALASEQVKQQMISEFNLRAFDSEFDPVVESIYGNRKESYIMIRGISDYKDGRKKKEWQQYSALAAAAFMKSIIVNLKPLG